jgi:hypothetical protein
MRDTYDSAAEAVADREQQKSLLGALRASDRALQRDECNAWTIAGTRGTIHTWGDGTTWVLYVRCRSALHWGWTKKKLAFCTVTQDGDDEGCLRLHQLPTPAQAEAIRDAVGIRKRREISETERERLRAFAFERNPRSEATGEQNISLGCGQAPNAHPDQAPILDAEPAQ